jgi:hypothetical protein
MATFTIGVAEQEPRRPSTKFLTIDANDRELLHWARSDQWVWMYPSDRDRESYEKLVEHGIVLRDDEQWREHVSVGRIVFILSEEGAAFWNEFRKVFNGAKSNTPCSKPSIISVVVGSTSYLVDLV